jgi:ABC-type glycerol-3-phosphate transport system permease component
MASGIVLLKIERGINMVRSKKLSGRIADIIICFILLLIIIICLIPIINTLALSLSSSVAANAGKVFLWPVDFTIASYDQILNDSAYLRALIVSFARTIVGTMVTFVIIILMAYPLSKNSKVFPMHNIYLWFIIGAMLFSGGLIPTYMVVYKLGLINSFWSMIIPCAVPVFSAILIMNYMKGLPAEIEESSQIDGASPFTNLVYIIVPMCKPVLATVALFTASGHWNQYFDAMIYMNDPSKWPVQTYIQSLNVSVQQMSSVTDPNEIARLMKISGVTFNSAKVFVAMIPILIVYPFVQKFFVGGIVMGAVKG